MTASVLQERESSVGAVNASTIALALSSSVTAGSAIHVFATCDSSTGVTISSCSDSVNGAYPAILNQVNDTTNLQRAGHFYFNNSSSGTITVTVTFSGTVSFRGILIREIGGVTTTAKDGNNANFQLTPTTTANAVVSGTATDANQPVLMSSLSLMTAGGATAAPTIGTGFTLGIHGWNLGGATNYCTTESQRFTSTATRQSTFTAAANVGHLTLMAMFDESGGGASGTGRLVDGCLVNGLLTGYLA